MSIKRKKRNGLNEKRVRDDDGIRHETYSSKW